MSAAPTVKTAPPLSARADTETVQEILTDLARGRLHLPEFQREWRWQEADQVKLLDSVLQGIPIGTLLLSDPFIDRPPPTTPGRFVLDGQQRLHTLRQLISPTARGARALHFDAGTRTFRFARVDALDTDSSLVPVALLGDQKALLDALMAPPVPKATLAAALEVSQRLREYRVPVYHLRDATEEVARTVFDRINASGRRLRQAEVFNALHARGGDAPVSSTKQLVDALKPLGFGTLDQDEITKTVAVLTGHDPGRDVRGIKLSDAPEVMQRTLHALRRAITFLMEDADIPRREALPYVMPLLVLARLFDLHAEVTPRTRILLRRWVWRGAATGAHQGARASLREALRAVAGDEHAAAQALLRQVPREASLFSWTASAAPRLRHATDRVVLCALAARRPLDLRDGSALDVTALIAAGSLCPLLPPGARGRSWETMLLHPRLRRSALVACVVAAPPERCASHVISDAARAALTDGDEDRFVAVRGADLQERVRRFLVARAEWTASDHPSLSSFAEAP
jgi:hypothetical protein